MILDKLRDKIKNSEYEAILLTGLENPVAAKNLKYVTGYTGSFGFAIIGESYQYFISDFRYKEQVSKEVPDFTFVEIKGGLLKALAYVIEREGINKLGFDKKMRFSEYEMYQALEAELIPMDNVIESLRVSKNANEIALLKKACEITDQALREILLELKVGMKERELEVMLKSRMLALGADGTWDRFIVASGARGAMPHGMASDKVIEQGDMVTFDIGCIYKGYSSDLTRTVSMGTPDPKLAEIYDIVLESNMQGINAAKAGITGAELDKVCRDVIEDKGYGENFGHGTGHGLGLDVHEAPRVSKVNTNPLELGACVTIEPGIYVEGLGGVRIEDDVILTEEGCIVLNEFPKELIIIE
jgi:Xaa-Pro aminopeptidase